MARLELDHVCREFEAPVPSPAGGSAAAAAAAIAASLVVMVGRGSPAWAGGAEAAEIAAALRERLLELGGEDVDAVAAFLSARATGSGDADAALEPATRVPLEIVTCALDVAELAGEARAHGKRAMRADATAARELALTAARIGSAIAQENLTLSAAPTLDALRETARDAAERLVVAAGPPG